MKQLAFAVVGLAFPLSLLAQSPPAAAHLAVSEVEALATMLQGLETYPPSSALQGGEAFALAQKMMAEANTSCTTYAVPYAGVSNGLELWGFVDRNIPSATSCYLSGPDPWDFWTAPVKAGERVTFAVESTVRTYFSVGGDVYFGSTTLQPDGKYLGGYVWQVPSSFTGLTARVAISPYATSAKYTLAIGKPATTGGGTCTATGTTACLLNNRFRVSIAYVNPFSNPPNQPGTFLAGRLLTGAQNPDVGLFGFSSSQAVEVVVRIQDTRPFAPRFDVYYGGLTDVGYTITVTDTLTGSSRQYVNQVGKVGGGVDRTSFPAN